MKSFKRLYKVLIIAAIFSFALSCSHERTEKQKEFAALVSKRPNVEHVEWQTTLSLWVKVDRKSLGANPRVEAQSLAEELANEGMRYTHRSVCVNIYYGSTSALGSYCKSF